MLFNSIEFFLFLPLVFIFYWFIFNKNLKAQNILILTSSYFFYAWWDYRFLGLIFLSTLVDYFIGINIPKQNTVKRQKFLLLCSLVFNLGVLGLFKYYNFFIDSFFDLVSSVGYVPNNYYSLNIILPVGISFYTFQTMSYSIDIYKQKLSPTKDFISFASFVSFFPQLVAGPIERANNLLPQILSKRKFKYSNGIIGLRLILIGLFKKIVIADSLSPLVENIFNNYQDLGGGTLWLGAFYFAFQIYCDFSGYSDIAIGTAKLLGIQLMTNFNFPYLSRNVSEFWRRWHISLSSWFRDYLYIPLGGSKQGVFKSIRNILIVFIISGLWHGANWTFVFWGIFHAFLFIPSFLNNKNNHQKTKINTPSNTSIFNIVLIIKTFILVTIGWVFFRSDNLISAFEYLWKMIFEFDINFVHRSGILFCLLLILVEIVYHNINIKYSNYFKWGLYYMLLFMIISKFNSGSSFIYFNF